MAARISSSSRLAHLHHHPLFSHSQPQPQPQLQLANHARRPSLLNTILASASSSPSTSSPSTSSLFESEPSPSFSASTASTLSLAASDSSANASASASAHDYKNLNRPSPNAQTQTQASNSNGNGSTFPSTPTSSSSPLESVAESAFSPASASSPNRNRLHPQHQQQHQQQLGANSSARGDLRLHRTGGFFAFAASALDRTQSAISPTSLRHKRSVSRLSISGDSSALLRGAETASDTILRHRPASLAVSSPSSSVRGFSTPPQEPIYSSPYTETDRSQPAPVILPRVDNKMHQTSSRLLRMTDDDRPFTKVSQPIPSIVIRAIAVVRPFCLSCLRANPSSSRAALCAGMHCTALALHTTPHHITPYHTTSPARCDLLSSQDVNSTCRTSKTSLRR